MSSSSYWNNTRAGDGVLTAAKLQHAYNRVLAQGVSTLLVFSAERFVSEDRREMAAKAERLTLMLAGGYRNFIPAELHEVGELLGFKSDYGWALPDDHPLAVAA